MLNKRQEQQLKQIDKEFAERGIAVFLRATPSSPCFKSVFMCTEHSMAYAAEMRILTKVCDDVKSFDIKMSAKYLLEMLRRQGIHGVAIHRDGDGLDYQFGEFVAKARLLKHIKKMEKRADVRTLIDEAIEDYKERHSDHQEIPQ